MPDPADAATLPPGTYDPKTDVWQAKETPQTPEDVALSTPRPVRMTPDLADLAAAQQTGGRFSPLAKIASDYFLPFSNLRNPDTPEARQAYDQALARAHQTGGGKIPQAPGSPILSPGVGAALDIAGNVGGKVAGAVKGLGVLKGAGLIKSGALPVPGWISHRFPTAAGATENALTAPLIISADEMRGDPELWANAARTVTQYPNLGAAEKRGPPERVLQNFQDHIVNNLLWLHDRIAQNDPRIAARSRLWYEGANAIARRAADLYGIPLTSTSGVYAALSPQKDWYMNAALGERVLNIYHRHAREVFRQEMLDRASQLPVFTKDPGLLPRLYGKRLTDLNSSLDKAAWIRAWDQTFNDPAFRIVTPEGDFGDFVKTQQIIRTPDGPQKKNWDVAWNPFRDIAKAITSIEAKGDMAVISRAMGLQHKVRNFYNNIFDPWSPMGDVTIDTHAVAAGLLRPLAGGDPEVIHNLSGPPGSALSGISGTYGLFADAYRRAALERNMLPREMQSITWEGGRGLFTPDFKTAENKAAIERIWQQRRARDIREIQELIHQLAGGIDPPAWHR